MRNIEKVRNIFLSGDFTEATNSDILQITGIKPHQQVYQLTAKLVEEGFLRYTKRGREKVFFLAKNRDIAQVKNGRSVSRLSNKQTNSAVDRKENTLGISVSQNIQILIDVGFDSVGAWIIDNDTIKYSLSKHGASKKILYAFASEGNVLYIGKTIRSLSQRLYGYLNPGPTQSTNIKNRRKIEKILRQGREINIFVFAPHENEIIYRGISVNLAAGLEDSLIGIIKPPWNDTGKII